MGELSNRSPKTPPEAQGLPTPVASGGGRSKDQHVVENNKQQVSSAGDGDSQVNDTVKQENQQKPTGTATSWEAGEIARLKTLVAHYELQNKLLTIESYENAQRFEVESSIMQREVDRLLMEKNAKRAGPGPEDDGTGGLDEETAAQTYRRRLRKGKLKLRDAAQLIREKDEEIERLKRRLREGRLHREAMEARNRNSNNGQALGLSALGMLANQALQGQSTKPRLEQDEEEEDDDDNENNDVYDGETKESIHTPTSMPIRRPSAGSTVTEEDEEDQDAGQQETHKEEEDSSRTGYDGQADSKETRTEIGRAETLTTSLESSTKLTLPDSNRTTEPATAQNQT